jgi:hypothetical protein
MADRDRQDIDWMDAAFVSLTSLSALPSKPSHTRELSFLYIFHIFFE